MNRLTDFKLDILRRHESLWVLLLFLLLTIIAGWNVVTNLDGVIIGNDNDVYINPWADWWTYKALTDPDISLWQSDAMYYPIGADLTFHSFSHLNTAVSLGLRPLLGDLPAYNVTVLINYVLAGLSMFQLAKYQTKSTMAGILAGIVFAFNSQNLYQSAHTDFVSVWCFPWITLFFIRAVQEDSIKLAILAAIFVFLGAATSTVLVILMVFWLSLLVLYMFFSSDFPKPPVRILLAFSGLSGLLIFPLIWPLLKTAIYANNTSFIIDPTTSIRTDIFTIFVPHWFHWFNRSLYLGIVPFYLAMIAFGHQKKEARLWFILIIAAFLFAIGPVPKFSGLNLGITLPWTLPVAPLLRQMYRMMIIFSLGWAMVVAYGWLGFTKLLQQKGISILPIFLIIGLMTFIDYTAVPFPSRPNIVSTFYTEYLENVPDNIALAILPTGRQEDKRYMYYQSFHGHSMSGGMIARGDENVFRFIEKNSLLRVGAVDLPPLPFPNNAEQALAGLAEINIGFLIIDKGLLHEAFCKETSLLDVEDWREAMPIEPIFEDELLLVFATSQDNLP